MPSANILPSQICAAKTIDVIVDKSSPHQYSVTAQFAIKVLEFCPMWYDVFNNHTSYSSIELYFSFSLMLHSLLVINQYASTVKQLPPYNTTYI